MFDSRVIPSIYVGAVELGKPQAVAIFDDRLGPGAAHRGAEKQKVFDLRRTILTGVRSGVGDQRVSEFLEAREIECLIELSLGRGRFLAHTEAKRAGPIVRRAEQVVELVERRPSRVSLDDPSAPMIRAGISQRPEQTFVLGGLIGSGCKLELYWIDLDSIRSLEVAPSVDQSSPAIAAAIDRVFKTRGGDGFGLARQRDVDKALAGVLARTHRRALESAVPAHARPRRH